MRRLWHLLSYTYYCSWCGAGPFTGDADLAGHMASEHGRNY